MKERQTAWLSLGALAAAALFFGSTPAFANHPGGNVPLLDKDGAAVTANTPYSPKKTCGGCHNYGSGTKIFTKNQGSIGSDGEVYFKDYNVTAFEHGVSVGRHMNQGRNEDYSAAMRTTFGDPFFTSSPGMWGKF